MTLLYLYHFKIMNGAGLFRRLNNSYYLKNITFNKKVFVNTIKRYYCIAPSSVGISNYEEEWKTFKVDLPSSGNYNFVSDVFEKFTRNEKNGKPLANETALWHVDETGKSLKLSFSELGILSRRAANVLTKDCNLSKGDCVIIMLGKIPEFWVVTLGSIRAGIVLSPATTLLQPKDINYRINTLKAKGIITLPEFMDKIDEIAGDCPSLERKIVVGESVTSCRNGWQNFSIMSKNASDKHECANTKLSDPMITYFTSGTTGEPKVVPHTQGFSLGFTSTSRYWYDNTEKDMLWVVSDPGWGKMACGGVFGPWLKGTCVFAENKPGKFDPVATLEALQKYPISIFCAPPTVYRLLVKEDLKKYKFPHLRNCVSAGEPLNAEVYEEWKSGTGHSIREGYGQTELGTITVCTPLCIPCKPGSLGKPTPGSDIQIVDDNGNILPAGKEGNIGLRVKPERPFYIIKGYLNDDKMEKAIVGDFYISGDRAYKDEDGYLWFVSRSDDIILSSGYNIGPFEVESALIEHPSIIESAAIAKPDKERGYICKAFVILSEGYKNCDKEKLIKELQDHVKAVTAPYKYPREIEFVDDLPRTISGKIRRVELRERERVKKN